VVKETGKSFDRYTRWLGLIGIIVMTVSGQRLGYKVGASWEFAGFAFGILWIVGCAVLPLTKRLAQLEKSVSDLMAAKADQ
jgi:hypothetical protein